jgi:hypothetical protein
MSKNPQLLVEYFPLSYNSFELNEAIKNNGVVRIKAILQKADSKNQNGRVYPLEILTREAQTYLVEFVNQRRALGELDHPESRTVVNLATVSHNIVEMHWDGDTLVGTIEVLNTPAGNIVKALMQAGIRLGVSSRGVGSVRPIGENSVEVEDDFKLICFDIVSNPSTDGAFLNEGVNRSLEHNRVARIHNLISDFLTEVGGI